MKRILQIILLAAILAFAFSIQAFGEGEPNSYSFELAVDGKDLKEAKSGDIITVTVSLQRTDSDAAYTMYSMQNEIEYDSTFFEYVEDSAIFISDINITNVQNRDYHSSLYINYLSFGGGVEWKSQRLLGSFQLRVIGDSGASSIESRNSIISKKDGSGSYPCGSNVLTVKLNSSCTVKFETNGAKEIPSINADFGEKLSMPKAPIKNGAEFAGWYKDIDFNEAWDFKSDTVTENTVLYAKWNKLASMTDFTDVSDNDWFYEDVLFVTQKGLMIGTGSKVFSPNSTATRGQIVTILYRLEGSPEVKGECPFKDVASGSYYEKAIIWAASNSIVNGYGDDKFGPDDSITREQLCAIFFRYAKLRGTEIGDYSEYSLDFVDKADISSWATEALCWMNANGIINGVGNNRFDPLGNATRAQAAAILRRFSDFNSVG